MQEYITDAFVGGIAVFVGLYGLWTILRTFRPGPRAGYALFAGAASAVFTLIVSMTIAAMTA